MVSMQQPVAALHNEATLHCKELVQIQFSSYEDSVSLRLVCNTLINPHENLSHC